MPSAHSTRNVGAGYRLLPGSHPAQMTVTRWHLRRRKLREHARKVGRPASWAWRSALRL
jgi:hypothetical protein